MSNSVRKECHRLRLRIENTKVRTKVMFDQVIEVGPEDLAEARANMELVYRHLEDARMRLGKVIQAIDGGTSIYDKEDKPGAVAGESAENEE